MTQHNHEFLLQIAKDVRQHKLASYNVETSNIYNNTRDMIKILLCPRSTDVLDSEEAFNTDNLDTKTLIEYLKNMYYIQYLFDKNIWNISSDITEDRNDKEIIKLEILRKYTILKMIYFFTYDLVMRDDLPNDTAHTIKCSYYKSNEELVEYFNKGISVSRVAFMLFDFSKICNKFKELVEEFVNEVLLKREDDFKMAGEYYNNLMGNEASAYNVFMNGM